MTAWLKNRPILIALIAALLMSSPAASYSIGRDSAKKPLDDYLFAKGKKLYESGRPDQAVNIWKNIPGDSFYDPVIYILSARAYAKLGNHDKAEALLASFLKKYPRSPYESIAQHALFEALCAQKDGDARKLAEILMPKVDSDEKIALMLRVARLSKHRQDYRTAAKYYRELFLKHPASIEGLKAARELAALVLSRKIEQPQFSKSEQLARANLLFKSGRFDLAAFTYQKMLKDDPADTRMALKLARCYYKYRRNHKAISLIEQILSGQITHEQRLEALHLLSLLYWRLDRDKEFKSCCSMILKNCNETLRRRVLFNLASHELERGEFDKAEAYFEELLRTNPPAATVASVKWKMAWIKYRGGNFESAALKFREVRSDPRSGYAIPAKYWEARSLMHSGRNGEAESLLVEVCRQSPFDYYGRQAMALLESMGSATARDLGLKKDFPEESIELSARQRSNPTVTHALKLMDKDLNEFAFLQLETLPRSWKSSGPIIYLRAKAAHDSGQYRKAFDVLATRFSPLMSNPPPDSPKAFVDIAFPRVHFEHTVRTARKLSVDPNLVWAIVRQESLYDADAISPAGALGLMQVMPKSAGLARKNGAVSAKAISDLLDPTENLAHGIRILSSNIREFNGRLVPAIASYNADIRKVRQWVKRNRGMTQDEFIECIPYLETRLYVKKVLAGLMAYKELHRRKDLAAHW